VALSVTCQRPSTVQLGRRGSLSATGCCGTVSATRWLYCRMPEIKAADARRHLDDLSKRILAANRNSSAITFAEEPSNRWPGWYGELLSKLYAVTRRAQLDYVTSDLLDADGREVLIFTDHLVVRGRVEGIENDGEVRGAHADEGGIAQVDVVTWSRALLTQTSVEELDPLHTDGASEILFPAGLRIGLLYIGQPEWITIPLGTDPNAAVQRATADFHETLLEGDLHRPARWLPTGNSSGQGS
jgi:hypothetical protein